MSTDYGDAKPSTVGYIHSPRSPREQKRCRDHHHLVSDVHDGQEDRRNDPNDHLNGFRGRRSRICVECTVHRRRDAPWPKFVSRVLRNSRARCMDDVFVIYKWIDPSRPMALVRARECSHEATDLRSSHMSHPTWVEMSSLHLMFYPPRLVKILIYLLHDVESNASIFSSLREVRL